MFTFCLFHIFLLFPLSSSVFLLWSCTVTLGEVVPLKAGKSWSHPFSSPSYKQCSPLLCYRSSSFPPSLALLFPPLRKCSLGVVVSAQACFKDMTAESDGSFFISPVFQDWGKKWLYCLKSYEVRTCFVSMKTQPRLSLNYKTSGFLGGSQVKKCKSVWICC